MADTQRPLQDYPEGLGLYILYIYLRIRKIRKEYEQERKMSRLVRVSDSVRHAQAQGLARRIQQRSKAATPPPRQEAK